MRAEPQNVKVSYGEGKLRIFLFAVITGDGLSVTVTGGERPHVGGMALSLPRPSLSGGSKSCDTWVCPVPGHKDSQVAEAVAELLCRETGKVISVTAGIHVDRATENEIGQLVENAMEAARSLIVQLKVDM